MAFFTVDACTPGVGALNMHGPGGVGGGRAGSDSLSRKPDTPHSPDAEGSEGAERPRELTGEAEKGSQCLYSLRKFRKLFTPRKVKTAV